MALDTTKFILPDGAPYVEGADPGVTQSRQRMQSSVYGPADIAALLASVAAQAESIATLAASVSALEATAAAQTASIAALESAVADLQGGAGDALHEITADGVAFYDFGTDEYRRISLNTGVVQVHD